MKAHDSTSGQPRTNIAGDFKFTQISPITAVTLNLKWDATNQNATLPPPPPTWTCQESGWGQTCQLTSSLFQFWALTLWLSRGRIPSTNHHFVFPPHPSYVLNHSSFTPQDPWHARDQWEPRRRKAKCGWVMMTGTWLSRFLLQTTAPPALHI